MRTVTFLKRRRHDIPWLHKRFEYCHGKAVTAIVGTSSYAVCVWWNDMAMSYMQALAHARAIQAKHDARIERRAA